MRYSMIWKCRGLLHAGRAALNVSLQGAAKTLRETRRSVWLFRRGSSVVLKK
jgi:hypothetical protein